MKNKFTGSLCVMMCFVIVLSMFAACSVKDKNGGLTTQATLTPDDTWAPDVDSDYVYQTITISKVELVDLVKEALGDEISEDWNGDLNTLTPEQLEKVEEHAKNEGLTVEKDESGNTVIKKEEVVTTEASQDEINQLMTKASVKDPSNISDEEYNRLSQVAQSEGYVIVTKPAATNADKNDRPEETKKNDIVIAKPVTTIKAAPTTKPPMYTQQSNNTTKAEKTTENKPLKTTKPVPKTTSVYKPPNTPGTVAPMAPVTQGIPAPTRDWTETFKKNSNEVFVDSAATNDGGVVAVGVTYVKTNDDPENALKGNTYALIVKYDKNGKVDWSKTIGGNDATYFEAVDVLTDGSIAVAGYTMHTEGSPYLENAEQYKCDDTIEGLVARFNTKGDLLGNIRIYGGSADDMIYSIAATADGGYVIGGKTESVDGDMDGINSPRARKGFVIKCNSDGTPQWKNAINAPRGLATQDLAVNEAGCVYATVEGSGDAYYGDSLLSSTDATTSRYSVVLKLSPAGNLEWYKTIYGTGITSLASIEVANDGGCVVAGHYSSGRNGNDKGTFEGIHNAGITGTFDGMLVKFAPTGDASGEGVINWTCPLRGFETEQITGITKIDGGYAVSGFTQSTNRDFDMMPGTGDYDSFVYIINDLAAPKHVYIYNGSGTDNARTICSNGNLIFVAGSTNSGDAVFAECDAKGTKAEAVGFVSCLTLSE
ncbi:MAG: hypothetical protein IJE48_09805 [Clostridia bacterium]|nr:hypothetical protein [Clostridia bacterium]